MFGKILAQEAQNGPGLMPQALKTHCLIQFWSWQNVPFLHIGPLG